jgi:hypothetical protein
VSAVDTMNAPLDLAALLDGLAERLHEPDTQERWYPGSAAGTDTSALPYYRVPSQENVTDLLAAALVRPSGIRFDFDDWLEVFESQVRDARTRTEVRSVGRYLRIALAGGVAGAIFAVGCVLVFLALIHRPDRPNPYIAVAVALGGLLLVTTVTVAIVERRWRTTRQVP